MNIIILVLAVWITEDLNNRGMLTVPLQNGRNMKENSDC